MLVHFTMATVSFVQRSHNHADAVPQSFGAALADRLEGSVPQSLGPQWVQQSLGAAAADCLERSVPQSLGAGVPQSIGGGAKRAPATICGLPEIVKCTKCAGRGSKGILICKVHCHHCAGTGEASKKQLLNLLNNMRLGNVDAAVVLHAVSADKRDDMDIALAAVGRFPKAFQFVSERLKAAQEVIDTTAAAAAALKKDMLDRSLNQSQNHSLSRSLSLDRSLNRSLSRSLSLDRSLNRSLTKSTSRELLSKLSSCDCSHASTAATGSMSVRLGELPEEGASEWGSFADEEA